MEQLMMALSGVCAWLTAIATTYGFMQEALPALRDGWFWLVVLGLTGFGLGANRFRVSESHRDRYLKQVQKHIREIK
ncbi:hypothetical protein [Levilactobacillus bambusae]|uniref:Holin n=1 Tax=Levilactobacillus bambusae TaxID=2024736 RepID=A0A2V1MZZ1_9LACO|nr:hypothetical protein [Levilactobacillus bambusae]PWF99734.1 hypothetical protein DCM90_06650 [Levilactobacillus bambusae]